MNYGIGYMGSKSGIVAEVCKIFPHADHFYDLFGGGFSVSHFMLSHRSNDYKTFTFNEIRPGVSALVENAILGKYNYDNFKPEFITREKFFETKDHDAYVRLCWSFGNNGKDYLFNPELEKKKHALHNAVVFNEFSPLAVELLGIDSFSEPCITKRRLSTKKLMSGRIDPQQLEQLQRLERLQRLEGLEGLQRLNFLAGSYADVKIKSGSVVYCDPPYQNVQSYEKSGASCFDSRTFFDWACDQSEPVFVSEYDIKHSGLTEIWSVHKRSTLSSTNNAVKKIEKVYANAAALQSIKTSFDLFFN